MGLYSMVGMYAVWMCHTSIPRGRRTRTHSVGEAVIGVGWRCGIFELIGILRALVPYLVQGAGLFLVSNRIRLGDLR